MHASQIRLRALVAVDVLIVVACALGLNGLHAKARLPATLERASGRPAAHAPGKAGLPTRAAVRVRAVGAEAETETSLRAGDVILEVSSQAVQTAEEIEFLCDWQRPGDGVHLRVERGGRGQEVEAILVPHYTAFGLGVNVVVAAVFLGLGILVRLRGPAGMAAAIFHAGSASFAVTIAATWGALGGRASGVALLLRFLFGAAYALAPALFLHFTFVFPRTGRPKPGWAIPVLYACALGLGALQGITFARAFLSRSVGDFDAFLFWFNVCLLFVAAALCGGVARLVYSYRTSREESDRRRLRLVLLGFAASVLTFVGAWVLPQAAGRPGLVPEAVVNLAALAAPLAFATAIVRYQALDIDALVNRGTVYAIVAACLVAMYAAVAAVVVGMLGIRALGSFSAVSAVTVVLGVVMFDPLRRRVQRSVDRTFFRVRYDAAEALRSIERHVVNALDETEAAEQVVSELDRLLKPARAALLAVRPGIPDLALLAARGDAPPTDLRIDRERLPVISTADHAAVEAGARIAAADPTVLRGLGAVALFPLHGSDATTVGWLVIGRKKSGLRLTYEDLDLLDGAARVAGHEIGSLRLREELLLRRAEARRAGELARARADFVSNVTHELRTPLTSIRMFAELLRTGVVPADRAPEYLGMVEGEADRLTRLIDNVLDFGRIERSVKEYRFAPVAADDTVRRALDALRYALELGGFRARTSLGAPGVIVRADADAVCQAIVNLVENAMKYSGEARDLAVTTRAEANAWAIDITDCGIGIPAVDRARIFEPFARGTDEAVRQSAGAGLGLSIVRHIMDAHGGRVDIQSAPGRGSTFTLVFPVERRDASHPDH